MWSNGVSPRRSRWQQIRVCCCGVSALDRSEQWCRTQRRSSSDSAATPRLDLLFHDIENRIGERIAFEFLDPGLQLSRCQSWLATRLGRPFGCAVIGRGAIRIGTRSVGFVAKFAVYNEIVGLQGLRLTSTLPPGVSLMARPRAARASRMRSLVLKSLAARASRRSMSRASISSLGVTPGA